jgi:hypothetical protein
MDYCKYDYVGGSVGISNDGSRYVVAAPGINLRTFQKYLGNTNEDPSLISNGCVYAFYNDTIQKIEPSEKVTPSEKKDRFGTCARISGDGSTIAIGSYNAERVYVYRFRNNQYEYNYEIAVEERTKVFGYNLWISGNGDDIVVGAPEVPLSFHEERDGEHRIQGAVFHYRNGTLLHQIQPIEIDENRLPEHFGRSIWLSDDAETLMIGSMGNSTIYEFAYVNNDWYQTDIIRQDPLTDFGNSISRDGEDYLIGAKNGSFAMHNDIKISGTTKTSFGGSVKLRHGHIVIGNFEGHSDWFGYSVDIFPNGNVLVGSPLYEWTGRYQILTPAEARDAGLYCERCV